MSQTKAVNILVRTQTIIAETANNPLSRENWDQLRGYALYLAGLNTNSDDAKRHFCHLLWQARVTPNAQAKLAFHQLEAFFRIECKPLLNDPNCYTQQFTF